MIGGEAGVRMNAQAFCRPPLLVTRHWRVLPLFCMLASMNGEEQAGDLQDGFAAALAAVPVMIPHGSGALRMDRADAQALSAADALLHLAGQPHLVCHATMLSARLRRAARRVPAEALLVRHFDIAELFAFACPASLAPPLPQAFAAALGLAGLPSGPEGLRHLAGALLARVADKGLPHPAQALELAAFLQGAKWPWAALVLKALEMGHGLKPKGYQRTGLEIWERLAEWEEPGPAPPPGQQPVTADEAQGLLRRALGRDAEARPAQMDYAAQVAAAFAPRPSERENTILLAEAGTGLGKTLGYLAPAAIWAGKNAGSVWISTYTKNLQRQLGAETRRIWPDAALQRRRVAVRKGRENYLCLLNAQDRFASFSASTPQGAALAALIARWALASADGDMVGGDFPAWLMGLLSVQSASGQVSPMSLGLTDRRGECSFAACPHFRKCFIEKARVRAARAGIVIANHAVVLTQAAAGIMLGETAPRGEEEPAPFTRLVFDEGHHLFDAADSAFSGHLTGLEAAELRRWIKGPESSRRRGRSLRERLGDLVEGASGARGLLGAVEAEAACLPASGWRQRIAQDQPQGAAEVFFSLVRAHVLARAGRQERGREIEADCLPAHPDLLEAAERLEAALTDLRAVMGRLAATLLRKLAGEAAELSSGERGRIESLARSLRRRGDLVLGSWCGMLRRLLDDAADEGAPDDRFASWFSIEYAFGSEYDTGLHAHWIDPTIPLAECVLAPADSVVITSATLRDRLPDAPDDWQSARMRTGAAHLPWAARRVSFRSPFDYGRNARVFIVTDLGRENMDQLAAAYRALFLAAGGGALGLFTAISRLRAVHERIQGPLAQAGLPLFAQHVDPMDTGTLVDLFRWQRDACLLGTDAVRDGVDVPTESLRLMVMDRVPWPRPAILERARRAAFGGQAWTDMMVRLRLRQAFGRLIRRQDDRGVFVMLDGRMASRFLTAFPAAVPVKRTGLAQAITETARFLES